MVGLARSWDSGGRSEICRFRRAADAFKGMAYAMIVLEFFEATGMNMSARRSGILSKNVEMLTLHYRLALD